GDRAALADPLGLLVGPGRVLRADERGDRLAVLVVGGDAADGAAAADQPRGPGLTGHLDQDDGVGQAVLDVVLAGDPVVAEHPALGVRVVVLGRIQADAGHADEVGGGQVAVHVRVLDVAGGGVPAAHRQQVGDDAPGQVKVLALVPVPVGDGRPLAVLL